MHHIQPYQFPFHYAPSTTTVTFNIGNSTPRLNGRALDVASGRCVGGGSSVHFMVLYARAPPSYFDDWAVDGWKSEGLILIMKMLETYEVQPGCPTHGYDGPIKVSSGGYGLDVCQEFIDVRKVYHKRPYADDTDNLETCNTYSPCAKYIDGTTGRRSDAATHYLYNQVHNPNLQIWADKRVKRVIFEEKRAVGVEFTNDLPSCLGADQSLDTVRASKLAVVSAGAFGSPTILERSEIGAKAVLQRCNIEQLVDLPGVGENYRDHNLAFVPYLAADGVVTMDSLWRMEENVIQGAKSFIAQNGLDAKIKWRPDERELKSMGSIFEARWKEFFQDRPDKAVAIFAALAGHCSKSFTLRLLAVFISNWGRTTRKHSTSPLASLDESDIAPPIYAYKKTREIFRRMPSYRGESITGHPRLPDGSAASCGEASGPVDMNAPDIVYTPEDDEAIDAFHHDHVQTTCHSLGTCATKAEADQGVVDSRLNVYGVTNLKVADSMSIAPKNVGGNTYSTALLIGEKAATTIAEDLRISLRGMPTNAAIPSWKIQYADLA